jgi:hypothetical protein
MVLAGAILSNVFVIVCIAFYESRVYIVSNNKRLSLIAISTVGVAAVLQWIVVFLNP